jgi:small-conductance mechanosensitive channel
MPLALATFLPGILPAALALLGLLAGIALRRTVLTRLARLAERTPSQADDAMVAALSGPVVLWLGLLGLVVGVQAAGLSSPTKTIAQRGVAILLVASITWTLARLAGELVRLRADGAAGHLPATNLLTNLAKAAVVMLGGLVILDTLGLSITPLITALGVGGVAVGLALQDTLANLFAGIHILLSRQVRPGDFVRLSSGEEGYVQDVTWRYTAIRQLPNNLTIVPNTRLASAVTANFNLPDPEQAVPVEVGVSYGSDLRRVEHVTVEVGQQVMREVSGGVPGFSPFIRYHTFGDSSVDFTVILRGQDYVSQYLIKHEFIKRLHERYRAEGIEIPFPIRTVHWPPRSGAAAADERLRTPDPSASTAAPPPR